MPALVYEAVGELNAATYDDLSSHDSERVIRAILSISWYEEWNLAQDVCFDFADSDDHWVRKVSITGLGHIARIHGAIDLGSLLSLYGDLTRGGLSPFEFQEVFRDFMVYVACQGRRNV